MNACVFSFIRHSRNIKWIHESMTIVSISWRCTHLPAQYSYNYAGMGIRTITLCSAQYSRLCLASRHFPFLGKIVTLWQLVTHGALVDLGQHRLGQHQFHLVRIMHFLAQHQFLNLLEIPEQKKSNSCHHHLGYHILGGHHLGYHILGGHHLGYHLLDLDLMHKSNPSTVQQSV